MKFKTVYRALIGFLISSALHGQQYQVDSRVENAATQGTVLEPASPTATGLQFAGFGSTSSSSDALGTSSNLSERYPSNASLPNTPATILLRQSTMGGTFASGIPRYSIGERITPPLAQIDDLTPATANYWRAKPVLPGEIISGVGEPIPDGTVTVISSSTNSTSATVESVTAELRVGATLLGQPITDIVGNNITLGGNARSSISGATVVPVTPATSYYYSPHAEKVFASQAGRTTITWVTNQPVSGNTYGIKTETFGVSANAFQKPKTIYWTEGSFEGPRVPVRDSRVTTINPVYNPRVPKAVKEEINLPGYTPLIPNLRTLYFDKLSGNGDLKAYNVEGRIIIEYLGGLRLGQDIHEHLGIEIIDIKRVPEIRFAQVNLGTQILPSDGSENLIASPVITSAQDSSSYYASQVQPDGRLAYFAEATTSLENRPDNGEPASDEAYNQVSFYWLENGQFGTEWPRFQERYWLRWSPILSDYQFYTVDDTGSTAQTGISFGGGGLPEITFQDDPNENEAKIDLTSQRLVVDFRQGNDRNRSLLKFSSGSEFWYINLYSQSENRSYELASTVDTYETVVEVLTTQYLLVGDIVATSGYVHVGQITEILDGTRFVLSTSRATNTLNRQFPAGRHPLFFFRNTNPSSFYGQFSDGLTPTITNTGSPNLVSVDDTSDLEIGMILTDSAGLSTHIIRIIDGTSIEVDTALSTGDYTFSFTVEPDSQAPISAIAPVGSRISPPAGHERGGYISSGDLYQASAYIDPFTAGVEEANNGAIIPVNAIEGRDKITVRWFKKVAAPNGRFSSFFVPGKIGRYTLQYPSAIPIITIAEGVGSGDFPLEMISPSVYFQNDQAALGYNPNEEHALVIGSRAYPLRDDLNITSGENYTSDPVMLLAYIDASDQRPNMAAYKVQRTSAEHSFNYKATAGTLLNLPYPLGLMSLPLEVIDGKLKSRNFESSVAAPANTTLNEVTEYQHFTFKDRKGFTWVHRGAHAWSPNIVKAEYGVFDASADPVIGKNIDVTSELQALYTSQTQIVVSNNVPWLPDVAPGEPKTLRVTYLAAAGETASDSFSELATFTPRELNEQLTMKLYYKTQESFFIPGLTTQPDVGTIIPFLRDASLSGETLAFGASDGTLNHQPLDIHYRPVWPDSTPKLRMGETLTLPKFGLPQVRGQKSAVVFYQQSLANGSTTSQSVVLHDPTREKVYPFGAGLDALPESVKTTHYQGKVYFQRAPAHLQKRFYFDPLRGTKGELVLLGEFHDVPAGEDYLDLNVLSDKEAKLLKGLVPSEDSKRADWDTAIDSLSTVVETFRESSSQKGSFQADVNLNKTLTASQAAYITDSDTAVDSYAVTATGMGGGYVTMVFGNGEASNLTPEGDPVQVKVFKVEPRLYTGDLKVIQSSNPLDEQVSLRHSGDFAAKVSDYEFEWRWSPGAASAPRTYVNAMEVKLASSALWRVVEAPASALPTASDYTNVPAQSIASAITVYPASYTAAQQSAGHPAIVLKSENGLDFTTGVPNSIVLSAELGDFDGFVLYINGVKALGHNAPSAFFESTGAASSLVDGALSKQFNIPPSFFTKGKNRVEMALFTTADPGAQSMLSFRVDAASRQEDPHFNTTWQTASDPTNLNSNIALIGGDPLIPFGASHFVLNDRWFTLRYRPLNADHLLHNQWSDWTQPMFVEGWIKRVLAAINPFEQRMKNLYENAIDSDVSVVAQAGTRWEGDIALTLDNITDVGLIEIYETVLNRARSMSIDANVNDPDTNNALILAAGYLNDLYNILGNEAFADAANPTISIDDQSGATEINTSRFSFEAQVATSLDEELSLLRGRDDIASPGVRTAPAYNRLYWNFTRGIDSGEVLYAVNYNIREKAGSDTANGVVDEEDAQRMFPQGHGDAYGHYLTALKGYYRLLRSPNFDWIPRAEAVTVLGQPVTIDYSDERKFASSAANLARSSEQILNLTYRKNYKDDPASGWSHLHDKRGSNASSGVTPQQGLDEWASRAAQGSYYHWALANSLLPEVDNVHQGVQKIDRTTVPELGLLSASVNSFQTLIDNANAHLNPLGLSPGAVAFDISPTELENGESHFEQVYSRAKTALNNAAGAFNRAAVMSRSLRNQETQLNDYDAQLAQQELAYTKRLIEIYGRPYNGDVGAGKLYAQGHVGPDLLHWFIVDQPNDLADPTETIEIEIPVTKVPKADDGDDPVANILYLTNNESVESSTPEDETSANDMDTVTIQPGQFVQYNKVWKAGGLGARPETGELQQALYESHRNFLVLKEISESYQDDKELLSLAAKSFRELLASHALRSSTSSTAFTEIKRIDGVIANLERKSADSEAGAEISTLLAEALSEYPPTVLGLSTDATSSARAVVKLVGAISFTAAKYNAIGIAASARDQEKNLLNTELDLEQELAKLEFSLEARQAAYELQAQYNEYAGITRDLYTYTLDYQRSLEKVRTVLAQGDRLQIERELFRQRAAAIIQGYRTRDLSFRLFRDESLEQYRSLYDLAARYCYLAAKSYDYETGLLGSDAGQEVFSSLVSSRALGDISNGEPQATTSTLGDAGLAGTMARLAADFSVAEGRLGINNPDQYGTVFSLRKELFRIMDDPNKTIDDEMWRQQLELQIVPDLMADEDVANQCLGIASADGGPVPGIILSFSSTIEQGKNFFGQPLAGGDHAFSPSSFATKIHSIGVSLPGYVGMDPYASGSVQAGQASSSSGNTLSATPYVYVIPSGVDYMLAPPLGEGSSLRSWKVDDQALPLPFNLGASDFNSGQFFSANGSLTEQPWINRKHQAFRAVADPSFFYSRVPAEFTNSRLVGRSAWNSQWKIVIPAYTLLNNEQDGLDRFVSSVRDIQLFLRTYSHSGN